MRVTMEQFIKQQIATWGEDYVDELFERKLFPVLTSEGWRWLYVSDADYLQLVAESESATEVG